MIKRFRYYDCLLVPKSSLTGQFPWHRVNLLVEYEDTGDGITLYPSVEHVTLKCNSNIFPGLAGSPIDLLNQSTYYVKYVCVNGNGAAIVFIIFVGLRFYSVQF